MMEELGPNARKGKGSVTRPSLSDGSTQPFKEENSAMSGSSKKRYTPNATLGFSSSSHPISSLFLLQPSCRQTSLSVAAVTQV
ncbi:unnamed protein product, partial [Prunus brigantina]